MEKRREKLYRCARGCALERSGFKQHAGAPFDGLTELTSAPEGEGVDGEGWRGSLVGKSARLLVRRSGFESRCCPWSPRSVSCVAALKIFRSQSWDPSTIAGLLTRTLRTNQPNKQRPLRHSLLVQ